MESVESSIVFRGTEGYHFIGYFTKNGVNLGKNIFLIGDVEVTVETLEPHLLGSIRITQVSLTLKGEAIEVALLENKLRKYFMTAGG